MVDRTDSVTPRSFANFFFSFLRPRFKEMLVITFNQNFHVVFAADEGNHKFQHKVDCRLHHQLFRKNHV